MSATTPSPEVKILRSLQTTSAVQATTKDPHLKIEAAKWQIFFSLPLSTVITIRDQALRACENVVDQVSEDDLAAAVCFSLAAPTEEVKP